jgi:hypothetical protein
LVFVVCCFCSFFVCFVLFLFCFALFLHSKLSNVQYLNEIWILKWFVLFPMLPVFLVCPYLIVLSYLPNIYLLPCT